MRALGKCFCAQSLCSNPLLLFVTLMALGLSSTSGFAQPKPSPGLTDSASEEEPPIEQMALTRAQIEALLAGQKDINAAAASMPDSDTDKPDPAAAAKLDAAATKFGFANYADYDRVSANVALIMSGFDPETKTYIGPEAVLKKEIAEVEADKQITAKDKKKALDDLGASLKSAAPIRFPENIKVVAPYYDKLSEAMQQDQ